MNPWEKYSQPAQAAAKPWEKFAPAEPESRAGSAAIESVGKGLSFGYLPELQAAAEPALRSVYNAFSDNDVPESTFDERVAENRARNKSLEEQHPAIYGAGELAGALAVPMPGGGAGGLLKTAGTAALASGLQNTEEGGLDLGNRAKNAITGGLIGGGIGAVAKGGAKLARGWANKGKVVSEMADDLTIDALGAKKKHTTELLKKDKVDDVAKFARDKGIVTGGESFGQAHARAKAQVEDSGKKISALYKKAQARANDAQLYNELPPEEALHLLSTEFTPVKMADDILAEIQTKYNGTAGQDEAINQAVKSLKGLQSLGKSADIDQMLKFRRSVDDKINFAKAKRDMTEGQEALYDIRDMVKAKIDARIDAVGKATKDPKLLEELHALNREHNLGSDVLRIVEDKVASEKANRSIGLIPGIVGTGGAVVGAGNAAMQGEDPFDVIKAGLIGASTGLAYKKARDYGPAIAAKTLAPIGGLLQKDPTNALARKAGDILDNQLLQRKLGAAAARTNVGN